MSECYAKAKEITRDVAGICEKLAGKGLVGREDLLSIEHAVNTLRDFIFKQKLEIEQLTYGNKKEITQPFNGMLSTSNALSSSNDTIKDFNLFGTVQVSITTDHLEVQDVLKVLNHIPSKCHIVDIKYTKENKTLVMQFEMDDISQTPTGPIPRTAESNDHLLKDITYTGDDYPKASYNTDHAWTQHCNSKDSPAGGDTAGLVVKKTHL